MTTTRPQLFSIRLPAFQRWATYGTLAVVAASGTAWLVVHDWMRLNWFAAEHRLLVTHGVAAGLALAVVGGLLPLHIRLAWRIRRNLWSGAFTLLIMGLLGLSGWFLYYGDEEWREITRWLHIAVGLLSCAVVPFHVWMGKRRAGKQQAPQAPPVQVVKESLATNCVP